MPTLTDPSAPITTESLLRLAMADPNTSAGAATLLRACREMAEYGEFFYQFPCFSVGFHSF